MPTSRWDLSRLGSANHLVRFEEVERRDGEAEGLGGLEVNDEFELHRLFDGEIGRLGTLKDFVGEVRRTPP